MNRNYILVLLLLIILNVLFAFYQIFSHSLHVDEGQYLLIAKKMLDGWVPYRDIIDNKPLGLYISLIPAVLLGGSDIVKLRLYDALINTLASFLVFLVGERIKNRQVGLIGAFLYILAIPEFNGNLLLTEPIANLFLIALFYILLTRKKTYSHFLLIGALAAVSSSIRQACIFVFILIAFDIAYNNQKMDKKKMIAATVGGAAIIAVPMLLYLTLNSALWDAFYWCVLSPLRFWHGGIGKEIDNSLNFVFYVYPLMVLSLITLRDMTREKKLTWLWLVSALPMAMVGFSTLHNYFFLLPPLSTLAALGAIELYEGSRGGGIPANVYRGTFIFLSVIMFFAIFFELSSIVAAGRNNTYYDDEWAVSGYISSHTSKDDGIFVFMGDPAIYYISDRKPVTKMTFFSMDFLWNSNEDERYEYIYGPLERDKPKYFVMEPLVYGNDSSIAPIWHYLDEKYTHVNDWGIFQLYERKANQ